MGFFFASAGLLVLGILRKELSVLLWGGGFFALTLVFLVSTWIQALHTRTFLRKNPLSQIFHFRRDLWTEGEEIPLTLKTVLPIFLMPGFRWVVKWTWSFNPWRSLDFSVPTGPGSQEVTVVFKGPRGRFAGHTLILELQDTFGMVRRPFDLMESENFTIGPLALEDLPENLNFSGEGESGRSLRKRRTEDLLDVRKYAPGDDWRRLHWKLYAHMGELFLRIGEESPPPHSRIWLVFDPFLTPELPRNAYTVELMDWRLRDFLSKARTLEAQGFEVKVLVPGAGQVFTAQNLGLLSVALGAADPGQEDTRILIPEDRGVTPLVFTTPRSNWRNLWADSLETPGGRAKEILFPWPDQFTGPRPVAWSWWQKTDRKALKSYKDFSQLKRMYEKLWNEEGGNA